jgi:hypothetical protein
MSDVSSKRLLFAVKLLALIADPWPLIADPWPLIADPWPLIADL